MFTGGMHSTRASSRFSTTSRSLAVVSLFGKTAGLSTPGTFVFLGMVMWPLMPGDRSQAELPIQDTGEGGAAGAGVRDRDLGEVMDIDLVGGRQRHAIRRRVIHRGSDGDLTAEFTVGAEREQVVIIDVLGLRGVQRTVESHDDLRGLVVDAESLDVDHHRAFAQVMAERLGHDREPAGLRPVTVALLVYWPMIAAFAAE